jgi:hypothetical protein
MKAKLGAGFVVFVALLITVLAIALPALAYQYPLSSTDIRNAYMLGTRKDSVTADFFASYRHDLPPPQTGPHVAYIVVATPYAQVVDLGQSAQNPDTQQAEIDLANKTFSFVVRVGIEVTATYPGPQPVTANSQGELVPDFGNDFKITLMQGDKEISSQSSRVFVLYSNGNVGLNTAQISGAVIELKYANEDIDPNGKVNIKVQTPDSQNTRTKFDLAPLK